jgi:hypothetical protein
LSRGGTVERGMHSSDGEDEFGEGLRDPMPRIDVGGKFVMTAVEILEEGVSRAERSCFNPRMGRSRDFSRPWSASFELFVYCSVT